jgi:DNA (cytosine-5)-methyltransferase 1
MFVMEIFSCAGGMAEGFRRAGLPMSMAIDYDADACASYAANLGHAPIRMDVRDLLRMVRAGWQPPGGAGGIDLLVADPPCTPWSRAGKRKGTADEHDMLVDTVELVARLRPRAFLIANVPGLDDGPNWGTVQKHIGSLSHRARGGYCIDFARLDAVSFGVPQHRVRPFWYGHAAEQPHLVWPAPTHLDPRASRTAGLFGELPPWVTCRQALQHLAASELGTPIRLRWRGQKRQADRVGARPARARGGHLERADEPSMTVCCKGNMQGAQGAAVLAWPWDRPSTVVHSDPGGRLAPPGHHTKSYMSDNRGHGPNAIKLSEKAAAILQGFPQDWRFLGATKRARWAQIGMAMPPPMAEAVARAIAAQLARGGAR